MEHFVVEGQWWLPYSPERRVPGTLTFDDDGLELVLYEALGEFVLPESGVAHMGAPEWKVEPVLHGRSRARKDFTLFEAGGANLAGPFFESREVYRPTLALEGSHTKEDRFTSIWCSFDYLGAWVDVPTVTTHEPDLVKIAFRAQELTNARLSDASVRLMTGVNGTAGGARVELTQWTALAITPDEPSSAKALIDRFSRPVQDLLMLSLGRPVRLTSVHLQPADQEDPREGTAQAFFAAVQPSVARKAPRDAALAIESYTAPTILSSRRTTMPLDAILTRWFELWPRHRGVLELLLSPLYAPFMYGEHGFASTFQSAEALHDLVGLHASDLSKAEHRRRVKAVATALEVAELSDDVREWVGRLIGGRNDTPLARRIEALVRSTGPVGEAVLAADEHFGRTVASARAGVSHGSAKKKTKHKELDPVGRYWYGQVLRWVVRTRILMELLDDSDAAQRLVTERTPFQVAVDRIGST